MLWPMHFTIHVEWLARVGSAHVRRRVQGFLVVYNEPFTFHAIFETSSSGVVPQMTKNKQPIPVIKEVKMISSLLLITVNFKIAA
jgi:hypothetical protein